MESVYVNNNELGGRSGENVDETENEDEIYENEYDNYNSIKLNNKNKKSDLIEIGLMD